MRAAIGAVLLLAVLATCQGKGSPLLGRPPYAIGESCSILLSGGWGKDRPSGRCLPASTATSTFVPLQATAASAVFSLSTRFLHTRERSKLAQISSSAMVGALQGTDRPRSCSAAQCHRSFQICLMRACNGAIPLARPQYANAVVPTKDCQLICRHEPELT